ncbi:Ubiquitin-protein ligase molybdopterin-converting factor [Mycena sanguinolenta]|uniref:Ubiquitin-protein ligase molybdopterin-converting factor n=1 Tax=Mycena sanguinolenta TaxID=230812 RepID=A0A8H6YVG5_9AGAR|nr:Ubiquitin-protein ligase molybdopterin-converting factor [Mycena sanguinolenta]
MDTSILHSHRAQLVLTAIAAAASTAALISLYTSLSRESKRHELDRDVLRSISREKTPNPDGKLPGTLYFPALNANPDVPPNKGDAYTYDETLIREQLARNYAFFGEEAMAKVRKGRVVVVGCGGVGSWAAVMLVRSGIHHIRLVDFDYVTLSSLNRHATASLADVGTPKVRCVARALKQMARWVEIEEKTEVWRGESDGGTGAALLEGADWVIDAIDNIQTKVDLLACCLERGIKVFSSMGAGAKSDPTRIQIADLADTIYDPLARAVRTRLRKRLIDSVKGKGADKEKEKVLNMGGTLGIPVVYSTEVPEVSLLPLPEDEFAKGPTHELGVLDEWRVRILPVLGPLPAIFGLNAATYVLCQLAGKPVANPLAVKGTQRRKVYEKMLRDLQGREASRAGTLVAPIPLTINDVGLVFDDIHRGRSVVPPHAVPLKPTLVVWDRTRPIGVENVVVMEAAEAAKHERKQGEGAEEWGKDVNEAVQRRVEEVERWKEWVM